MNCGRDTGDFELTLNAFSLIDEYRILRENTGAIVPLLDPRNTDLVKQPIISISDFAPSLDLPLKSL